MQAAHGLDDLRVNAHAAPGVRLRLTPLDTEHRDHMAVRLKPFSTGRIKERAVREHDAQQLLVAAHRVQPAVGKQRLAARKHHDAHAKRGRLVEDFPDPMVRQLGAFLPVMGAGIAARAAQIARLGRAYDQERRNLDAAGGMPGPQLLRAFERFADAQKRGGGRRISGQYARCGF